MVILLAKLFQKRTFKLDFKKNQSKITFFIKINEFLLNKKKNDLKHDLHQVPFDPIQFFPIKIVDPQYQYLKMKT